MVEAYCVKCKAKGVTMTDPEIHTTKKGGYMAKGKCPTCGTVMCCIMSKEKADGLISSGEAKKAA